jgi:hypothetical protein
MDKRRRLDSQHDSEKEAQEEEDTCMEGAAPSAEATDEAVPHATAADSCMQDAAGQLPSRPARPPRYDDSMTVFVKGLKACAEEQQVRELFMPCGSLVDVRMKKDHKDGSHRVRSLQREEEGMYDAMQVLWCVREP